MNSTSEEMEKKAKKEADDKAKAEKQKKLEEEQKQLPSDTDITITAHEIFNDRNLTSDVSSVFWDILEAVKIDQSVIE